ncbi:MAG TPA: adenosylcobinamide-phosphate synthase CbiB [Polyangiaceae bacterium]|jgi:adenosylcobinamide-phosphate synthase|nr:adenosylcobinamide-phosphate synthase CbiB [Polyangiaceae bacterium]
MNVAVLGWLPLAVALDLTFGEPPARLHPVVWMGKAIAMCERFAPTRGRLRQLAAGTAIAVGVPTVFAAAAWLLESRLRAHALLGLLVGAFALKTTFALRGLGRAVLTMRDEIALGKVDSARLSLRALCSRDATNLDSASLVAATIESAAENTCDSFVAPLFWFAVLGLPGAAFYRAVNTLDAMIGYHGRYEWLGKASARLDDVLNWLPARLTAGLLLVAGAFSGLNVVGGARVLWRDGALTESPNAGRPMAVMAGLLGVQLTKAGHYRLGDATTPLHPPQIERAWRSVLVASALATVLAALAVEVRLGNAW